MQLFFILLIALAASSKASGAILGATLDDDVYFYSQTYNVDRTSPLDLGTFHVGQHILGTGSAYDGHFNFASIRFDNLSSLPSDGKKFLSLNVKDFKIPGPLLPNRPPPYTYVSTGNFRLAVVALTDFLADSLTASDFVDWYNTHLYLRPRIAEVDVTQAGALQIDVTTAVDSWISASAPNFGFGLIGVASSPEASIVRFYSMESSGSFGPTLIPEPGTGAMLLVGMGALFLRRRRTHS